MQPASILRVTSSHAVLSLHTLIFPSLNATVSNFCGVSGLLFGGTLITRLGFYVQVKELADPFTSSQRRLAVIPFDMKKTQATAVESKPYMTEGGSL